MALAFLSRWPGKTSRIRRRPSGPPQSVRLEIEHLETRNCPSPVITNYAVMTTDVNYQVELKGTVTDSDPGSIVVTFSGCGISASTSLSGSASFDIFTTATTLGAVTANAVNQQTNRGGSATASLYDAAPSISNFQASQAGNLWTFTGQVTDDEPMTGAVVTLGGLPSIQGLTTTVNSNGWFSITVQLKKGESGTATAVTTDCWGMQSNIAWTLVHNF
jgi:hypothetical protein